EEPSRSTPPKLDAALITWRTLAILTNVPTPAFREPGFRRLSSSVRDCSPNVARPAKADQTRSGEPWVFDKRLMQPPAPPRVRLTSTRILVLAPTQFGPNDVHQA